MDMSMTRNLTQELCKREIQVPTLPGTDIWHSLSVKGMKGQLSSFAFKLLHNILPTKKRLSRFNIIISSICDLCGSNIEEGIPHSLLEGSFNGLINDWTLAILYDLDHSLLNSETVTLLNIPTESESKFRVLWFLLSVFNISLKSRNARKTMLMAQTKVI